MGKINMDSLRHPVVSLVTVLWFGWLSAEMVASQTLLSNLEEEIAALIERGEPAVTSIYAYLDMDSQKDQDSPFLSLFSTKSPDEALPRIKVGTGLFLHNAGFIATRKSVVAHACSIRVRLYNGEEMDAELIGIDDEKEIGLLRIASQNLPLVPLGQPEKLTAGSWIIVMGNSLGVTPAVSLGNVSAIRENGVIQITANIDPGHNGSPVLNAAGEIIGMVSGRVDYPATRQGMYLTVSNAALVLPIDQVYEAAKRILNRYSQKHGWLGITVRSYSRDEIHPVISHIVPGSPAEKAGLQVGDVILAFHNQPLDHYYALLGLVKKSLPGTQTTIRVRRGEKELELPITIGRMDYARLFETDRQTRNLAFQQERALPPQHPEGMSRRLLQKRLLEMERQLRELKAKIMKRP